MDSIIGKLPDIITGIASGGTAGSIAKAALALILMLGFFLINRWWEGKKNEAAQRETDAGRAKDQADIVDENQKITDGANKAESDIKDIFKPKP